MKEWLNRPVTRPMWAQLVQAITTVMLSVAFLERQFPHNLMLYVVMGLAIISLITIAVKS